jgi:heat-inducible transcriptional repressor
MRYKHDLNKRFEALLDLVVSTHIKTGRPVGSLTLCDALDQDLSPATIRSAMHELEALELIQQPHTSAGRIPTDKGYRYYVDYLMVEKPVAPHVASVIAREFRSNQDSIETIVAKTSRILSDLSIQAGFISFPDFDSLTLNRIEIARLGKSHLLVVWIMGNGFVHNRTIEIKDLIPDEELRRVTKFINDELSNLLLSEMKPQLKQIMDCADETIYSLCTQAAFFVDATFPKARERRVTFEGSRHILEQPEFQNPDKTKKLLRAIERHETLLDLFEASHDVEGVQIRIGIENDCEEVQDCSFVIARYQVADRPLGALGVMGPRRMAYSDIVGLVDFMARRLGETLERW